MASGKSGEGDGAPVASAYGISAYPTLQLIAPDKEIVEEDIWPAGTILSTLEKYQFTPIVADDPSGSQQYTFYSGSYIKINCVNSGNISISVSENNTYSASVYSLDGTLLKTAFNNYFTKGTHSIPWSNNALAKGQYILNLSSQKGEIAKTFILK